MRDSYFVLEEKLISKPIIPNEEIPIFITISSHF